MAEVSAMIAFYEREILDKATEKVVTVSDFSSVTRVPTNLLSSALTMSKKPHPMAGPLIMVVKNSFLNSLARLLTQAVPKVKIIVRPSLEEALEEADQLLSTENLAQ